MVNQRQAYKLLSPLWRRLRLLISRAVVARSDSGRGMQRLQLDLLRDETRDVEHHEPYGFTSRPLPGAEAIAAAIGGARGHLVALMASDRRHRLKGLAPGEVALYTDEGDQLVFKRGRIVRLTAGSAVEVTAPEVTVTASASITLDTPQVKMTGALDVTEDAVIGGKSFLGHRHPGDSGGTTGTPI